MASLFEDKDFLALPEEEQVNRVRSSSERFDADYRSNPEAALALLRSRTGKPKAETSAVGRVIRQFGSGLGESLTDTVQFPFEAAEWVASAAGSDWSSDTNAAIEAWQKHQFPAAETPEGRIARSTGYWAGMGGVMAATGGTIGAAGRLASAAGATRAGSVIQKGGALAAANAPTEIAAGAAGGLAEGGTAELTDNPWLRMGAGILASGAVGVGIAARNAALNAKNATRAGGAQSSVASAAESLPPGGRAANDAMEELTVNEQIALGQSDEVMFGPEAFTRATDAESRKVLQKMNEEAVRPVISQDIHRRITHAGGKVLQQLGIARDPDRLMMNQIRDVINNDLMPLDVIDDVMRQGGVSFNEAADAYQYSTSEAARLMQNLSAEARALNRLKMKKIRDKIKANGGKPLTKEEMSVLTDAERKTLQTAGTRQTLGERAENVRRGLLVTQLATAARNYMTQIANITVRGMEDALESGMARVLPGLVTKQSPVRALGTLLRMGESLVPFRVSSGTKLAKGVTKAMTDIGSDVMDPLTSSWISDFTMNAGARGSGVLGLIERGALRLNAANRLQEFAIRRAAFSEHLTQAMKRDGKDVVAMEAAGELGSISPKKYIQPAIAHALDMTWGKNFNARKAGAEGMAGSLIDSINKFHWGPLAATQVIPFPRFMMNAIEWQFQHSPAGAMNQILSKAGREALANGDVRPFIKATTGTSLFIAAHQLRNSEYAGGKWYEVIPPEGVAEALGMEPGDTLDTRAFNPFSSYLFAADVVKRFNDGTLSGLETKDVVQGFLATNMRAGAGLYVLDQFLDSLATASRQVDASEEFTKVLGDMGAGYAGATWSGMFVPFQQLKDLVAHFDKSQAVVRDSSAEPFLGPIKRRLPYADETMPEVQLPTRSAPPMTEGPFGGAFGRQITGLSTRKAKSPVELEYDRLDFNRSNILQASGDEEWDQLTAKHMGPMVEERLNKFVDSDRYKNASEGNKFEMLRKATGRVRRTARRKARRENPALYRRWKEGTKSRGQRMLDEERAHKTAAKAARMEAHRNGG